MKQETQGHRADISCFFHCVAGNRRRLSKLRRAPHLLHFVTCPGLSQTGNVAPRYFECRNFQTPPGFCVGLRSSRKHTSEQNNEQSKIV
jgi:hypothetical protein